jgi:hypothetical protein
VGYEEANSNKTVLMVTILWIIGNKNSEKMKNIISFVEI